MGSAVLCTIGAQDPVNDSSSTDLPERSNMGSSEKKYLLLFSLPYGKEERENALNYIERRVNYTNCSGFCMTNSEPVSGMQSDAYTAVDGDMLPHFSLKFNQSLT